MSHQGDITNLQKVYIPNVDIPITKFEILENFNIKHGVTIGTNCQNTSDKFAQNPLELSKYNSIILKNLGIKKINKLFQIITTANGSINLINVDSRINTSEENILEASFVCTTQPNALLIAKPADCPTAIIYSITKDNVPVIGVMHSGRDETDKLVPQKIINFLEKEFGIKLEKTIICLPPAINKENYFIRQSDLGTKVKIDMNNWNEYSEYKKVMNENYLFLDVKSYVINQFLESGIKSKNIYNYTQNTYELAKNNWAFSHRYSKLNNMPEGRFSVMAIL